MLLGGDTLIVNIGSASNSCQERDRTAQSPGHDPCTELEARAGLWRFSASRTGQTAKDGVRYATGLRNAMATAVDRGGNLYAAPHGRDQLGANWGFSDAQNAELPAEEFMQVKAGDDFGWPYCYYDWQQKKKVPGSRVRRRREGRRSLLDEERPADWLPRPLGPDGHRLLLRESIPCILSGRGLHRVSWIVEPRAVAPAGIPGSLRTVRLGPSDGAIHDVRDE